MGQMLRHLPIPHQFPSFPINGDTYLHMNRSIFNTNPLNLMTAG